VACVMGDLMGSLAAGPESVGMNIALE